MYYQLFEFVPRLHKWSASWREKFPCLCFNYFCLFYAVCLSVLVSVCLLESVRAIQNNM